MNDTVSEPFPIIKEVKWIVIDTKLLWALFLGTIHEGFPSFKHKLEIHCLDYEPSQRPRRSWVRFLYSRGAYLSSDSQLASDQFTTSARNYCRIVSLKKTKITSWPHAELTVSYHHRDHSKFIHHLSVWAGNAQAVKYLLISGVTSLQ